MQLGLENGVFYSEYEACRWSVADLRTECDRRAKDLANSSNPIWLGMSTGVDSQIVLKSFRDQNIPVECAFLYLPGYNEYEYTNLKILEKAWGFRTHIIDFDPLAIKDELLSVSMGLDIPPNQIMHRKFLSLLPDNCDFLQGVDGPFITFKNDVPHYYEGYNSYEVSRNRAFNSLNRRGKNIIFDRSSECILSILQDEVVQGFVYSYKFYRDNALEKDGEPIKRIDWWDFYIKPILYGRYWRDELFYFKKYQGPEGIDYIMSGPENRWREQYITVPMHQFMADLKKPTGSVTRYYEDIKR